MPQMHERKMLRREKLPVEDEEREGIKMNEQYYIVRCDRAGVFFGQIKERTENEVVMTNVRKLWYWDGAASISQIALEGVKRPHNCKFTVTVDELMVLDAIEIIPCTDKASA